MVRRILKRGSAVRDWPGADRQVRQVEDRAKLPEYRQSLYGAATDDIAQGPSRMGLARQSPRSAHVCAGEAGTALPHSSTVCSAQKETRPASRRLSRILGRDWLANAQRHWPAVATSRPASTAGHHSRLTSERRRHHRRALERASYRDSQSLEGRARGVRVHIPWGADVGCERRRLQDRRGESWSPLATLARS